jgi:hypothetical protein
MKENIEDKIVFSSEDEKNNYLSFITDEYNKNKVEVFKDSWKTIKKINTRSSKPDTLAKEFWNCYPVQAVGSGIILLLPVGAVNLFTIIGGSFLLLSGLSTLNVKNNKFRGLIAASCSLIASPFIFGKNLISSIRMRNIYKKTINDINSCSIKKESENEKNDRSVIVDSLIEKIDIEDLDCLFYGVISILERIKGKILTINDTKKCEVYINNIYMICIFVERIMNLSENKKIEALRFINNELSKIESSVDEEIASLKENISEEEYHQTHYISRG